MESTAVGGSVTKPRGGMSETVMVARATRRSRKLSEPCSRSIWVRMRISSPSTTRISETVLARSRSSRRRPSSRVRLRSCASRSTNWAVTSCELTFSPKTSPRALTRSMAVKNSPWGTRMTTKPSASSAEPERESCSTKPPRVSAICRTDSVAGRTSSTRIVSEAFWITRRSSIWTAGSVPESGLGAAKAPASESRGGSGAVPKAAWASSAACSTAKPCAKSPSKLPATLSSKPKSP